MHRHVRSVTTFLLPVHNAEGKFAAVVHVHQSYIINLSYLALIHNKSCLMYPPFYTIEIPLSSRYRKTLQERFLQL